MSFYALIRPLLFALPPELAHTLVLHSLGAAARLPGAVPLLRAVADGGGDSMLQTEVWGRTFPNPIGIAAGLDKDGIALEPLLALGAGFVEAGTVTPRPQPGNPRPRLFRLREDHALINRMGFNNRGADALAKHVTGLKSSWPDARVGVNLGKQRDTPLDTAPADYVAAMEPVYAVADYLVINVSSPNTPGLRGLQDREHLTQTVAAVVSARQRHVQAGIPRTPVLIKVAPDLDDSALADVVAVAVESGCDGLVATNTTLDRAHLRSTHQSEAGGLSGAPLREKTLRVVSTLHRLCDGRLPLIGVGGISEPEHAYALVRAGASLVQVYSGLVYEGPGLIRRLKKGLRALLVRDGFGSVTEAVGTAVSR